MHFEKPSPKGKWGINSKYISYIVLFLKFFLNQSEFREFVSLNQRAVNSILLINVLLINKSHLLKKQVFALY